MGTKVELTFQGLDLNNYYPVNASNYNGYQGFNFADMGLLTTSAINYLGYGTGTGYSNVIGSGENACAFTYDNIFGQGSGFGVIASSYSGETFSLKKGTFASAWENMQPTYFVAIGRNGHVKASHEFLLSQNADTINFTQFGTDFRNILAVEIISEPGLRGNQGETGYQIAMDNLLMTWNGSIPHSRHAHPHQHALPAGAAPVTSPHTASSVHGESHHHQAAAYHSVVASLAGSLGHADGGGLTAEFQLPHTEHLFGL